MIDIAARESNLVAALRAAFPAHRVRAVLGDTPDAARQAVTRTPEIHVAFAGWEKDNVHIGQGNGAYRWQVRILDGSLTSPSLRRVGDNQTPPVGIYPVAEQLRAVLAQTNLSPESAPLRPQGGRLLQGGEPHAVWEERFADYAPALGSALPVFIDSTVSTVQTGPYPSGTNVLTGLNPDPEGFAIGQRILIEEPGSHLEYLGPIIETQSTSMTVERSTSRAYSANAVLHRITGHTPWPQREAPPAALVENLNIRAGFDLAGGTHRTKTGPPLHERRVVLAPLLRHSALAFRDEIRDRAETGALAFADSQGRVALGASVDTLTFEDLGYGHVRFECTLHARQISAVADLSGGAA